MNDNIQNEEILQVNENDNIQKEGEDDKELAKNILFKNDPFFIIIEILFILLLAFAIYFQIICAIYLLEYLIIIYSFDAISNLYIINYLLIIQFLPLENVIYFFVNYCIKILNGFIKNSIIIGILFLVGTYSGLYSFIYTNIKFKKYIKSKNKSLNSQYYLYFETISLLLMHLFLLYASFYEASSINSGLGALFEIGIIFIFELIFIIINIVSLSMTTPNNQYRMIICSILSFITKIFFYILAEYLLSFLSLTQYRFPNIYFIFPIVRGIFMFISIIFCCIIKILN